MLKKILIALVVVIALFLGYVAMQPDEFKISRSTTINASSDQVFAQVNDFHKWEAWSPWAKLDPNMTSTFGGAEAGEGAMYSWAGNDDVGEGKMTIIKSQAPELILIQLDFLKPLAQSSITEFSFTPQDQGTNVTWTMSGKSPFISKLFCVFMDMDKMVGSDFEKGLASMKSVVEMGRM